MQNLGAARLQGAPDRLVGARPRRQRGAPKVRLPLPVDVGEALAAYLEHGRPPAAERALFVAAHRPWRGLSYSTIWLAVNQAGIAPVGAHRLRHSAATAMLRAGASLEEVARVLRPRSTQVTALYAKVDFVALSAVRRSGRRICAATVS